MKSVPLIIVGNVPPPIGGVRIHVARLCQWLEAKGIEYEFIAINPRSILKVLCCILRRQIVHLHLSNQALKLIFTVAGRLVLGRVIATQHRNLLRYGDARDWLAVLALRFARKAIALNSESLSVMKRFGCDAVQLSAFIPQLKPEILPKEIEGRIRVLRQQSFKKIIATNAHKVNFDSNGCELYGIRDLIRLCRERGWALIVSDPSGQYVKYVHDQDGPSNLDHVYFTEAPHSFSELVKHVDAVVRNTTTDGDSLSVHEALVQGTQVWASDCVSRPQGVNLFEKLDGIDDAAPNLASNYKAPSTIDDLVALYQSVYSDGAGLR